MALNKWGDVLGFGRGGGGGDFSKFTSVWPKVSGNVNECPI